MPTHLQLNFAAIRYNILDPRGYKIFGVGLLIQANECLLAATAFKKKNKEERKHDDK